MKINIDIDDKYEDTEITVHCRRLSPKLERIISAIRLTEQQITVQHDEETHILDVSEIVYIESVDRKTFVYTCKSCFESRLRLYEIEEQLSQIGFLRISKACIVQLKRIRSIKSEINRKLRLTLENGEQIIVSRQYADELKHRLGVK